MDQWKWLALSLGLVFAASVGMVGCGDDEAVECTRDEDCDPGEVCGAGNVCATLCDSDEDCDVEEGIFCSAGCGEDASYCFQACSSDGDCAEGFTCDTSFCNGRGICARDTPTACAEDDDCDGGQICDTVAEVCVDPCSDNTDCELGFVCNPNTSLCEVGTGVACTDDDDCPAGWECDASNECTPIETCDGQLECYQQGSELFCAAVDDSINTCVDTSCGVSFNSCSRCTSGPNSGSRDADGPSIFSASQVKIGSGAANCRNDLTQCQADAPILCQFQFFAFSPDEDDLPSTGLNSKVFVISGTGNTSNPFGVNRGNEGENATYSFRACFREGGGQSVGTAAFLESVSGKRSNTLCVNGTK